MIRTLANGTLRNTVDIKHDRDYVKVLWYEKYNETQETLGIKDKVQGLQQISWSTYVYVLVCKPAVMIVFILKSGWEDTDMS